MYDTGFKVLSMKINYLAPFKHKHQKFAHGNKLPDIPSLHGIGVMTFSMKIITLHMFNVSHRFQSVIHENKLVG